MRLAALDGWKAATCLCFACAMLPKALSQEVFDEDADPASRAGPRPFGLRVSELQLELDGSYESRRIESHRQGRADTSQENRDWRFDQTLNLRLEGHAIDPRIIQWSAGLRLGLSQEDAREELDGFTQHDHDSGTLIDYDIHLDFLPDSPLSGHAYARKGRDRIPRRFLPSLLEERSEAGAAAFWSLGSWSGELSLDWSDVDRSGNRSELDDEHLETTRLSFDNRWALSDRQQLRVIFDHERDESDYQGGTTDFDTRRDQIRVEHEMDMGDRGQHHLSSYFRYDDERGDLPRDELETGTRLSLRHSDSWQTVYRYSAYRVDQDAIEVTRHKADLQAIYKPDDRWRLTLDGFALRENVESDVETHQYGGGFDVSYRQPTASGEFRGNFSFQADQLRTVGDAGDGIVLGEVHVLDSVRGAFLREPDVERHTIRAYNAARTILYVEGRDYTVVSTDRLTSLYRILSGRIVEDEPVSVDYHYRIPAGSRVDTYRTDLRLDHAFHGGLTPYYSLDLRRQDATGSRAVPVFADNTERHRLGARMERPKWSGGAEVELVHDSVEPFDAFHTDLRIPVLRRVDHQMDGSVRFSAYDFEGDRQRRVHWFEIDATNRLRLSPYLSSTVKTAYRWEDNSLDGLTEGFDLECGLEYQRGALRVELIVEYDALDIDENSDRGYGIWLNIRRDLTHLVASGAAR